MHSPTYQVISTLEGTERVVRIMGHITAFRASPNFQVDGDFAGFIHKMMRIGFARLPAGKGPGGHSVLTRFVHECQLTFQDVDEFIFGLVPVAQCRLSPGIESRVIDSELSDANGIPKRLAMTTGDACSKRHRIGLRTRADRNL
jgi:hypothetical protein